MVMNTTFLVVLLSFLLAMVFSISFLESVRYSGGFRIELVHRESMLSPFYNSSETHFDRLRKSAVRSMTRVNHFSLSSAYSDSIVSQVIPNGQPDYLMKLSIGTPPIEVHAIADTGSDLKWAQCNPCLNCYKQDQLPLFDPKMSSTYRETSCTSSPCQSLESSDYAKCVSNTCEYTYTYDDLSETNGVLATETFISDSSDANQRSMLIPTLVFGCGHSNSGLFSSWGSGLVGLGGGPLLLVSQLGSKIDGKFSYCLVDMSGKSTSKLNFGSQDIFSMINMVSTPLVLKDPVTFYYLTLEAISVGGQRLENKPMNNSNPTVGNIVIDSGSTLTTVPKMFYNQLESAIRNVIPVDPIKDSSGSGTFNLCYSTTSDSILQLPEMIFHFSGADVRLTNLNAFALNPYENMVCLTIAPTETDDDVSIYGNLAQMNFLVEYDLVGRKVSFAPADCTQH